MGDRGNIVIVQHARLDGGATGEIYLYAHWSGSVIARVVQCALLRAPDRWDDEPYLGRIIFSELTSGFERDNLSFGISTYLTDNEHDLVVVDTARQTVSIRPPDKPPTATFTFADFAKKDLMAAHLVDEPMQCPTGAPNPIVPNGPIAGVEARPDDAAPPATPAVVASHVPYVMVGILVGAVVSARVVGSVRSSSQRR